MNLGGEGFMEVKDVLQGTKGRTQRATRDRLLRTGLALGLGVLRNPDPLCHPACSLLTCPCPYSQFINPSWEQSQEGEPGASGPPLLLSTRLPLKPRPFQPRQRWAPSFFDYACFSNKNSSRNPQTLLVIKLYAYTSSIHILNIKYSLFSTRIT